MKTNGRRNNVRRTIKSWMKNEIIPKKIEKINLFSYAYLIEKNIKHSAIEDLNGLIDDSRNNLENKTKNNERIITFLSYWEEKSRRKVKNINAKVIPNP